MAALFSAGRAGADPASAADPAPTAATTTSRTVGTAGRSCLTSAATRISGLAGTPPCGGTGWQRIRPGRGPPGRRVPRAVAGWFRVPVARGPDRRVPHGGRSGCAAPRKSRETPAWGDPCVQFTPARRGLVSYSPVVVARAAELRQLVDERVRPAPETVILMHRTDLSYIPAPISAGARQIFPSAAGTVSWREGVAACWSSRSD